LHGKWGKFQRRPLSWTSGYHVAPQQKEVHMALFAWWNYRTPRAKAGTNESSSPSPHAGLSSVERQF
jgi:hypothetical protein